MGPYLYSVLHHAHGSMSIWLPPPPCLKNHVVAYKHQWPKGFGSWTTTGSSQKRLLRPVGTGTIKCLDGSLKYLCNPAKIKYWLNGK